MPFAAPLAETDLKLSPLFGAPPAVLLRFEKETAVPVVVVTVTLFLILTPLIVPVLVLPVEEPVEMSSELTVILFPPSVTVPPSVGLPLLAIVTPPTVNVVPWPQSVWPAASAMLPVVVPLPV